MTPRMSAESPTPVWAEDCVVQPIRVVVVDDHPMLRASIRVILGAEADMEWVGEASDGAEAVALVARTRPDIVLMDLSMPGTDGLTATQEIVSTQSSVRVVVLTTSSDPDHVRLSLEAGAAAVLDKDGNPATILAGIRSVAGADYSPPRLTRAPRPVAHPEVLPGCGGQPRSSAGSSSAYRWNQGWASSSCAAT